MAGGFFAEVSDDVAVDAAPAQSGNVNSATPGGFFNEGGNVEVLDTRTDLQEYLTEAEEEALISEGWARGTQNGLAVGMESIYYQDNAKFWAEQAVDPQALTYTTIKSILQDSDSVSITADDEDEELTFSVADEVVNAATVTGYTVGISVPSDAVFTDTLYNAGSGLELSAETFRLNAAISDLTNVSTATPTLNQVLTWNGTTWLPRDSQGGGGNNPPDNPNDSKITINTSPSQVIVASSGEITITVSLSVTTGYTISDESVVLTITDTERNPVTFTDNDDGTYTFAADKTRKGFYQIHVSADVTKDDNTYTDVATKNIPVNAEYYYTTSATTPTTVSDMTNGGVLNHSKSVDITYTGNGGSRKAWFAVPTANSEVYDFKNGLTIAGVSTGTTIDTNWTLYEFTDFDDSQNAATFTLTIMEE